MFSFSKVNNWVLKSTIYISLLAIFTVLGFPQITDARVELTYLPSHAAGVSQNLEAEKEIVKLWNERNPDIKVNMIDPSPSDQGNLQKLLLLYAAGKAPDIHAPENCVKMLHEGYFLKLDPYIKRDNFDIQDFWQAGLNYTAFDGKHVGSGSYYALPYYGLGIYVLLYNEDLFEERGVLPPDESWTWEDAFLEASRKLTRREGDVVIQFGASLPISPYVVNATDILVQSFGGMLINEDRTKCMIAEPSAMKALQFMRDLIWVYRVVPGGGEKTQPGVSYGFQNNRIAMMLTHCPVASPTPLLSGADLNWNIGPVPMGPGGRVTRSYSYNIGISAQTKYPNEAWEFLKFLASKEAIFIRLKNGGMWQFPPRRSVAQSREFHEIARRVVGANKKLNRVLDAAAYSRESRVLQTLGWFPDLNDAFMSEISKVMSNQTSVENAVKAIVPKVEAVLKKFGNK